jgi:glutamate N-acetyltransferase / amino-acid N-acetyltransferase
MAAPSPFAPASYPDLPEITGVRFASGAAGIRYKDRVDVMLALFDKGTEVAGVFTKSKCASAPVEWCRARLKRGKARVLVVNSGNANAFTGRNGAEAAKFTAALAARASGAMRKNSTAFWRSLRRTRHRVICSQPPRQS